MQLWLVGGSGALRKQGKPRLGHSGQGPAWPTEWVVIVLPFSLIVPL